MQRMTQGQPSLQTKPRLHRVIELVRLQIIRVIRKPVQQ